MYSTIAISTEPNDADLARETMRVFLDRNHSSSKKSPGRKSIPRGRQEEQNGHILVLCKGPSGT